MILALLCRFKLCFKHQNIRGSGVMQIKHIFLSRGGGGRKSWGWAMQVVGISKSREKVIKRVVWKS